MPEAKRKTTTSTEAKKHGAIFFLESGDGNDFECGDLDCADLFGWVIQEAEADEFETI